jgi:hypothetical protein
MLFAAASSEYRIPELFEHLPSPHKRLLGFQRQVLLELHAAGLVRIIEITRPGKRSVQLVHIPSLIGFIEREEELAKARGLAEIRKGYAHHHKPEDLLEVVTE